jgi:transcriptional regulator with XRE-family HTH domain
VRSRPSTAAFCAALGKTIRSERKRHGWSQEELAERAELNRAYVTELESGRRTPNLDTLLRVSRALGLRLSRLAAASESQLGKVS